VKCNNCQQMGHYKSRCPNPLVSEDAGDGGFGNGGFDNAGTTDGVAKGGFESGGFGNDTTDGAAGGDAGGWGSAPVETSGGW
jgi:hypothetical protein